MRKDPTTLARQIRSKRCSFSAETRFTAGVFGKISKMHTFNMVFDIDVTCRIVVNNMHFLFFSQTHYLHKTVCFLTVRNGVLNSL